MQVLHAALMHMPQQRVLQFCETKEAAVRLTALHIHTGLKACPGSLAQQLSSMATQRALDEHACVGEYCL